jgi:glutaminyl-tRNA synthetase
MAEEKKSLNFIEQFIEHDIKTAKHEGRIHTRFPPEPNGYLHIGHAKSICLNFGIAQKYNGLTNLRFDDTNPATEETVYVDSIKEDIRWLGFDWGDREYYASDYFDQLYAFAVKLIKAGKAYIDESSPEVIATEKGSPERPGTISKYRERPIEETLDLFEKMKNGQIQKGNMVLRAKVDMASPNMHMRDPILYRIKHAPHHRTGTKWHIYPMYDFAHGQSDSIEGITHSLCTLEFENHRPLYNWFIENLEIFPSRQIEFARLNLNYTIMSKRKLLQLVQEGHVEGWDDPRMPTIAGIRRRGYTPASIRNFAERVGIAKRNNVIDISLLEHSAREDLNKVAERKMVVLDPLELDIVNYPEGQVEQLPADNNPEDEKAGQRMLPFSRQLYIERSDFMIDPPRKYFRLGPGRNVRLKHAYILKCESFEMDEEGKVKKVLCSYYPESKSGSDTSGVKAKGTLHWVSRQEAVDLEVRLYDRLFNDPEPDSHEDKHFLEFLNPDSLTIDRKAKAEPSLLNAPAESHFQFLRNGYFVRDNKLVSDRPVFNKTVGLRDSWAKKQSK